MQTKEEGKDGAVTKRVQQRSASFAPWLRATSCSLQGVKLRRLSKLYLLVRGAGQQHGTLAGSVQEHTTPPLPPPHSHRLL